MASTSTYFRVLLVLLSAQSITGTCDTSPLGMESGAIANNKITDKAGVIVGDQARLGYTVGDSWCKSSSDDFLQIDLGTPHIVCGVATQGNHPQDQWVISFKFTYSTDGTTYSFYEDLAGNQVLFANQDRDGVVHQVLYKELVARYVRIHPTTFQGKACMRGEMYGVKTITENIALGKPTIQSSMAHFGVPSRAVDGDRNSAWAGGSCTHTDGEAAPWWQVDLGTTKSIAEVLIVARGDWGAERLWSNTFELLIGDQSNGLNPKCGDRHAVLPYDMISIECNPRMSGRYIRIVLITAFDALTLCEVEVYTDNSMCGGQAIGISDSHVISDAKLTASSSQSGFPASSGRLLGASAWKPVSLSTDGNPWIMMNLGAKYHVCAVGTQGSPVDGDRSTVYMIDYSLDGRSWTIENSDNTGNRDQNTIIKNPQSMSAMFIRVRPRWRSGHPLFALRMEVYGVRVACTAPFGLENNTIPDGQISSNSSEASHPASQGRLYGASSWCGVTSSSGYLQVDLGTRKTVTGIATQGDHTRDNWVTKYKVLHSHDNKLWMETQSAEFDGNSDRDNVKVNWFTRPVGARYIRVLSTASNGATCMRMELYGCNRYIAVKVAPMSDVVLPASSSGHVDLQCLARGYGMEITFRWTLTESDVTHRSGGARRNNTHAMSSFRYNFTSAEAVFDASNCTLPSSGREVSCKSRFPYRCIAWYPTLPGGVVDYKEAFVTTTLKLPGKPFAVKSTEVRSRSISLTWSSPVKEDGELMTTSYKIELVANGTIYTSSSNQLAVRGLKPYTGYRFRVKAVSSRAEGPWSEDAHIVTEQEAPSSSPEGLTVSQSDGKTHTITWSPIPPNQSNGIIVVYEITWVKVANRTRSRRSLDAVSSANTSSTSYILMDLLPCSVYNISVRSYTIAGPGPFTRPLSLNTPGKGI
ncbi:uncharacterized protein LOC5499907 [Nematostella vectensis]|uniref:uncharacterized protein LOC5499907 n=1 Tax=Nematostella vectensis TaxID=45351 RepID=UPI0020771050|nr:uncharacterized protein LOC5499907 [Nematostella vectensis]